MIYIEQDGQNIAFARLTIEEISKPHGVIAGYFSGVSLPGRLESIQQLITSAANDQEWNYQRYRPPFIMVSQLERLLEALYLLQRDDCILETNGSKIEESELQNPTVSAELYCRPSIHLPTWNYIPKHLQNDEFINPYVAVTRFFDCRDLPGWRHLLSELVEFATLGGSNIYEVGPDFNVLETFSLLYKIVEAAHLIDVREKRKG